MLVLTDTGDLEPDLAISQKAVQSIGLRGKRAEFSGIKVRYESGRNSNKEQKICARKPICR